MTHICVGKLTIIGSDNGLSPGRRQAIIWTSVGILSSGPLGTNFSEVFIEIETFSFTKMHLNMSSGKCRPHCVKYHSHAQHRGKKCTDCHLKPKTEIPTWKHGNFIPFLYNVFYEKKNDCSCKNGSDWNKTESVINYTSRVIGCWKTSFYQHSTILNCMCTLWTILIIKNRVILTRSIFSPNVH